MGTEPTTQRPATQTVVVSGGGARRLTVAAVDDDHLVATATIVVDEHSVPGQLGSAGPDAHSADSRAPAAGSAPKIVVEALRLAPAPRLRLTVARRIGVAQVRARGLRVMLGASRAVHVEVTVRRGTRVVARHRFAATPRARSVTLRLPQRQLRELAQRHATTLTVETSAAGAAPVRRRIVVRGAR